MTWESELITLAPPLIEAGLVAGLGFLVSDRTASWLRHRGGMPSQVRGVRVGISLLSFLIAALILFVALGPINLVSSLTFSAILTLAVTLALQTTLGNIIAGFILLNNRVLRLNDTIQISGVSGRVVRLGLVTVWLRLDDGSLVSVSNSTLLAGPLLNRSVETRLQGEY